MTAQHADRCARSSERSAPTSTGQVSRPQDWNSFGEALYNVRIRRGLHQADVARNAHLSRGYYSALENSKRRPPPRLTVRLIGQALGLTEADLLELELLAELDRDEHGEEEKLPRTVRAVLRRLRLVGRLLPPAVVDSIAAQLDRVPR